MPDLSLLGRAIFFMGVALVVLGGLLWLAGRATGIGRLPGDIVVQTGNVSCFFPIVSMLVLSLVLTIVLNVAVRLLNR